MGLITGAQAAEVGPSLAASSTIASSGMAPPPEAGPVPTIVSAPPAQEAAYKTAPTIVPSGESPSSLAQAFDTKFKGTSLEGQWGAVEKSAAKYGVSPSLVAGIMAHETGNGSNVKGNNPGGLMDPASNWQKKQSFGNIRDGIDATAKVIASNYNASGGNIERMAARYAPVGAKNDKGGLNSDWLPGVRKQIAYFQ